MKGKRPPLTLVFVGDVFLVEDQLIEALAKDRAFFGVRTFYSHRGQPLQMWAGTDVQWSVMVARMADLRRHGIFGPPPRSDHDPE